MKKPGPKIGKRGKKRTYSFTLHDCVHTYLQKLAQENGVSASRWLQDKINEKWVEFKLEMH